MNTIKWNNSKTGFVLTYEDGRKETFSVNQGNNTTVFVKVNDSIYWLIKG